MSDDLKKAETQDEYDQEFGEMHEVEIVDGDELDDEGLFFIINNCFLKIK
jgi:hypothetical protein